MPIGNIYTVIADSQSIVKGAFDVAKSEDGEDQIGSGSRQGGSSGPGGGNGGQGGSGGQGGGNGGGKHTEIEVNGKEVKIDAERATGLEIKRAAIAQHVNIQENFVLQQELPNGSSVIVGDNDVVKLHEHLRFTAIAPDDNS